MPREKGGYFLAVADEAKREAITDAIASQRAFSIELLSAHWDVQGRELFLLGVGSDSSQIVGAGIARKKHGPRNTGAFNVLVSEIVTFDPVSFAEAEVQRGGRVRPLPDRISRRYSRSAIQDVLSGIKARHPEKVKLLDALWRKVVAVDDPNRSHALEQLSIERDAIGLALDAAGMQEERRRSFRAVPALGVDTVYSSFIELMDNQENQERHLIEHDRFTYRTLGSIGADHPFKVYSKGLRQLKVWSVDRGPIERQNGVRDLRGRVGRERAFQPREHRQVMEVRRG